MLTVLESLHTAKTALLPYLPPRIFTLSPPPPRPPVLEESLPLSLASSEPAPPAEYSSSSSTAAAVPEATFPAACRAQTKSEICPSAGLPLYLDTAGRQAAGHRHCHQRQQASSYLGDTSEHHGSTKLANPTLDVVQVGLITGNKLSLALATNKKSPARIAAEITQPVDGLLDSRGNTCHPLFE